MEKALCPVCGKYEFEYEFDVCEVCGWEHDLVQEEDPDYRAGPNLGKSLNMCKKEWEEHRIEKTQAICCMFARENAEAAETQSRFDRVESISDSYRYSSELLRCRLCGAYVIRKYVETACYMPGEDWDDAECTMIYYPTSGPEETAQPEKEAPLGLVPGDRVRLEVSWRESKPSRKSYRFCRKETGGE